MTRLVYVILILASLGLNGQQVCTGNLGENIFAIGDFGSGSENIISTNPGIAPGYNYTTNPPPNDGFYIITNDMRTSAWDNLFGTWIKITDNSDDPEGYMMVVNASFEPGIFYEEEVTGLCGNTLYEFSSDVINLIRIGVGGHHEPNLSFYLDDVVQYSSGIIPQDETWHKHGFTFTTEPDQTSVKLSLRNNAPGGIGNDLALDNISFRPCGPSAFANASDSLLICSNDLNPAEIVADTEAGAAIQWQYYDDATASWISLENESGTSIFHNNFDPGEYLYRYLTAGTATNLENEKCRVISDEALVTVIPIEFTVYDTICENVAYEFGTQLLTEAGFYEETLLASSGCDSFVDLFLTVVPDPGITMEINALDPLCFGAATGYIEVLEVNGGVEPYTFDYDGIEFEDIIPSLLSGTYSVKASDRYSCMSINEVVLVDPEAFSVNIGADTAVEFGTIYEFLVESNEAISAGTWLGSGLNCETCINNQIQPFETGTYIFNAKNDRNCEASDTIVVAVRDFEDLFYQPNVFSPNEDGVNDIFRMETSSQAIRELKEFSVFDRFGNRVFSVLNRNFYSEDHGWNGMINGTPAQAGIYTYLYKLTLINDEEILLSGEVAIIR